MPHRSLHAACLGLALLSVGGCAEPFESPSAYETQRDLCAPEHAEDYQKEVDACRTSHDSGGGCGGVISFKGTLQGRPLTVESRLSEATLGVVPEDGQAPWLDEVETTGASPYFSFIAKLRSVGGRVAPLNGATRHLQFVTSPNSLPDPFLDDNALFSLRLVGADTVGVNALPGNLTLLEQSPTDVVGTFDGTFGAETDTLQGCFHVLPLSQRIQSGPR